MEPDRRAKVNEEVECLISVGFIKLVEYLSWVSNIATVPKKNRHIRVCIDFTNLIKLA